MPISFKKCQTNLNKAMTVNFEMPGQVTAKYKLAMEPSLELWQINKKILLISENNNFSYRKCLIKMPKGLQQ